MSELKEEDRYLSIQRVAEIFDVSPQTVRKWLDTGILVGVQLGGSQEGGPKLWRVSSREVARFAKKGNRHP